MIETCLLCHTPLPYAGSRHVGSRACYNIAEQIRITANGLIPVSPPAFGSTEHTNRAGTLAVCEILGLDYKLVRSSAYPKPWICVTPEVEETLLTVNRIARCVMLVIPEAARRLVDKRDLLIEYDAQRRLGADDDALFDLLALAGVAGQREQFEARCRQRNPRRSDLSIKRAWDKAWARTRRRARARNLKNKT